MCKKIIKKAKEKTLKQQKKEIQKSGKGNSFPSFPWEEKLEWRERQ